MLMTDLTSAHRRTLKARAHHLEPVVLIGDAGLTPAVLAEIDVHLKSHELIKVRISGADREERNTMLAAMCSHTGAMPIQHIGKIVVIYRENPKKDSPRTSRPRRPLPRKPATISRFKAEGNERKSFATRFATSSKPGFSRGFNRSDESITGPGSYKKSRARPSR